MMRVSEKLYRYIVAVLIIGAHVLCVGTLVFFPMPPGNRELLATLTGALTLLARDATRWVFPTREPHAEEK